MKLSKAEVICYLTATIGFFSAHVLWQTPFWVFYVVVGCAAIFAFLINRGVKQNANVPTRQRNYISPYRVQIDALGIRVWLKDIEQHGVHWSDLLHIGLRIENEGFVDTPYWLFGGTTGLCFFPSDAVGGERILDELTHRLTGVDYRAVIEAMGSTSGGWTIWEKPDGSVSNMPLDTHAPRGSA